MVQYINRFVLLNKEKIFLDNKLYINQKDFFPNYPYFLDVHIKDYYVKIG